MGQEPAHRSLPPAKSPVYLVLLWPDGVGRWEGRIKEVRTGAEQHFYGLKELLSWLEKHQEPRR